MADFVFNIAKGRVAELAQRVISNDPTNSALVVVLMDAAEADATLKDRDDLSLLLAEAGNTEATFTNYARKEVTASITRTPDDTNERQEVDFPDQTWTAAGNGTNNTITDLIICYDNDTTGTGDSNLIPLTNHDFVVTTDGSDLTAQLNAAGFFRATD